MAWSFLALDMFEENLKTPPPIVYYRTQQRPAVQNGNENTTEVQSSTALSMPAEKMNAPKGVSDTDTIHPLHVGDDPGMWEDHLEQEYDFKASFLQEIGYGPSGLATSSSSSSLASAETITEAREAARIKAACESLGPQQRICADLLVLDADNDCYELATRFVQHIEYSIDKLGHVLSPDDLEDLRGSVQLVWRTANVFAQRSQRRREQRRRRLDIYEELDVHDDPQEPLKPDRVEQYRMIAIRFAKVMVNHITKVRQRKLEQLDQMRKEEGSQETEYKESPIMNTPGARAAWRGGPCRLSRCQVRMWEVVRTIFRAPTVPASYEISADARLLLSTIMELLFPLWQELWYQTVRTRVQRSGQRGRPRHREQHPGGRMNISGHYNGESSKLPSSSSSSSSSSLSSSSTSSSSSSSSEYEEEHDEANGTSNRWCICLDGLNTDHFTDRVRRRVQRMNIIITPPVDHEMEYIAFSHEKLQADATESHGVGTDNAPRPLPGPTPLRKVVSAFDCD